MVTVFASRSTAVTYLRLNVIIQDSFLLSQEDTNRRQAKFQNETRQPKHTERSTNLSNKQTQAQLITKADYDLATANCIVFLKVNLAFDKSVGTNVEQSTRSQLTSSKISNVTENFS